MRIGSLFSGAGGLDMAVEAVFGGHTVWHCEVDSAASKVLAARWPDVPNLIDITQIDWTTVAPVDILCGGWPCQPFSLAGKRKGAEDERALWPHVAHAVRVVRPRIVVLENVSAVLGPEFQRVANDLAALGYDIAWTCLRASDVGAPHRRERVFILATDTSGERHGGRQDPGVVGRVHRAPQSEGLQRERSRPITVDRSSAGDTSVDLLPTPTVQQGRNNTSGRQPGSQHHAGDTLNDIIYRGDLLPTPMAHDAKGTGPSAYNRNSPELSCIDYYLPTPAASDGTGGGRHPDARAGHTAQIIDVALLHGSPQWGKYEPAIRRWETLTRPAPSPTEPNTKGNPRLSAAFSEWMMGWPEGWVTDVPGISRNDALRIIGNGVVPQQATAALRWLLNVPECAA